MVHRDGLLRPELALRGAEQQMALGPLRASVIPRPMLALARKVQWPVALRASCLLCNGAIWSGLSAPDF
eukprot:9388203-Pyramimonas_sp.AAC.1